MSTGDHFAPAQLHTREELNAMRTILGDARMAARRAPVHREPGGRKRWSKEPKAKSAQRIKNPLYSRALDASGVNDGNQGKTLNGVGIPQNGQTFSGAYTYPGMGIGNP
jgi:hypothetical protein